MTMSEKSNRKRNTLIVGTLLMAITSAFIGGSILYQLLNTKGSLTKVITPPATNTPTPLANKIVTLATEYKLFPSPTGKYTLVLSSIPDKEGRCNIDIFDSKGDRTRYLNLTGLLGVETIICNQGMLGLYSEEFLGWQDNTNLAFQNRDSSISIVTIADNAITKDGGIVSTYNYSYQKFNLEPLELNKRPTVFAFQDISDGRVSDRLVFVDLKSGIILKELSFKKDTVFHPDYDQINDGYVVVQRFYTENTIETKILFLDMRDYSLKTVLHKKPAPFLGGRGCGPSRVRSIKLGELIYDTGGCLTLDREAFSSNGFVHINL